MVDTAFALQKIYTNLYFHKKLVGYILLQNILVVYLLVPIRHIYLVLLQILCVI